MTTAKEISRLLAQRAEEVARHLLPNGKKEGSEWRVGSINGEAGHSLGVHLNGEKAGLRCDFSAGDDKGDLLDLWVQVKRLTLRDAINEASGFLGLLPKRFEGYRPASFAKPRLHQVGELSSESKVVLYLTQSRKLAPETIRSFKIAESEQNIIFPYWRDGGLVFVKRLGINRIDGRKQISVEPNCEPSLFGWHLIPANARAVTICEGEIDAMTLHQYGFPALSVPFGGGAKDKQKWVEYEFDRLAMFDEIFLCFDNDTEGQAAVHELITRLGRHRCRIVSLPKKDANECLQAGIEKSAIQQCYNDAATLDPEELKSASDFVEDVIDAFNPVNGIELGYQTPWEKTKGKVLFRPEELSIWTGINGHGKSQFLGQVMLGMMKQGARVCVASLELKPRRLLARLARQAGGLALPTEGYLRAIHGWYQDKLWLFDLVGTAKFARLLEVFLYARQKYGVDVFIVDSFMKLDIAEDDYNEQKRIIEKLCDFKNQYGCQIHVVVHPRKSHDETKPPGKLDNKGSGAITDLADNCFTVWRNKAKEEVLQRQASGRLLTKEQNEKLNESDCFWCCDKQRNGDWEGKFGFWFHAGSLQYLERPDLKPNHVVEYSTRH